jgi:hypothetical protein
MDQNSKDLGQDRVLKILENEVRLYFRKYEKYYKKSLKISIISAISSTDMTNHKGGAGLSSTLNAQKEKILKEKGDKIDAVYQSTISNWYEVIKAVGEYNDEKRKFEMRLRKSRPSINNVRVMLLKFLLNLLISKERIIEMYAAIESKIIKSSFAELSSFEFGLKSWPADAKQALREVAYPTKENKVDRVDIFGRQQVSKNNRALKEELDKRATLREINEENENRKII